ncbi:MAG: branched-chain amino acid ABC transporter permease [Deltaproteobacteria bacterium]|nr:branched-chain amino acid ABC transporter permease [Deltaproteobacteria bacterium]MBW2044750.1 branched-chain amino acid ABC transporter permease [Deltaproteobacteria bacterium]MBW2301713.1 branched-chain amino acid ABC transporter permease [Deltaproteobacteria bacterium]
MNFPSKFHILLIAGIILILVPFFVGSYFLHVMIIIFFYAFLAESWNILGGLAGQLSLGHGIFFGVGAYTSSIMFIKLNVSPWVGFLVGGVFAAVLGLIISFPVFHYKLRGAYYALVTLAYVEIFEKLALKIEYVGGALGILIPLRESSLLALQFQSKKPYYYICFALMIISIGITHWAKMSRFGYILSAIKEDEDAAEAVGVNATKYKLIATALSAFLTAMGGVFYAQYTTFIDPKTTLSVFVSIEIVLRPIIGGVGTILGPILGSFVLTPLSELTRLLIGSGQSGVHLLVYGIILIVVCLRAPRGIFVEIQTLFRKYFEKRRGEVVRHYGTARS